MSEVSFLNRKRDDEENDFFPRRGGAESSGDHARHAVVLVTTSEVNVVGLPFWRTAGRCAGGSYRAAAASTQERGNVDYVGNKLDTLDSVAT